VPVAHPSVRPRYGGTLRIQTEAKILSLEPSKWTLAPDSAAALNRIANLVFECLVRLDEAGQIAPGLAVAWQGDSQHRQWQFRLRPGVFFHDGAPLTPSAVVSSLEGSERGWRVSLFGETVLIQTEEPRPDLLFALTQPRYGIYRRAPDGALLGTGPFRLQEWVPRERALLATFENYWDGRPFVDAIELQMGRPLRQQRVDLELGRADVVEFSGAEAPEARQASFTVWVSKPVELLLLVFPEAGPGASPRLREAIASAIDRTALSQVLLRRQGEPTGALLPNWLTGYGFVFPWQQDLAQARELFAPISAQPTALRLSYDAGDALARAIAERIALNVREAGIILQPEGRGPDRPGSETDVHLVRWQLPVANIFPAMRALAERFGMLDKLVSTEASSLQASYETEKALLQGHRLIPLVYVPLAYGLHARVKNWTASPLGNWNLAEVWLEPTQTDQPESER
jgi:ABC-type transport system substrate-binding protein